MYYMFYRRISNDAILHIKRDEMKIEQVYEVLSETDGHSDTLLFVGL